MNRLGRSRSFGIRAFTGGSAITAEVTDEWWGLPSTPHVSMLRILPLLNIEVRADRSSYLPRHRALNGEWSQAGPSRAAVHEPIDGPLAPRFALARSPEMGRRPAGMVVR